MAGDALILPPGTKMNAQSLILVLGVLGEIFQGGLFFGWSALSIMITDQGNFEEGCSDPDETIDDPGTDICKSQESKLALLWTLGAFSLNSGPILGGFALDYLGPRFVSIAGVCLNMLGLILFGTSSTNGSNAFIAAAIILGLGNITFHLAQFHISSLFPTKRGLITSVFVAGFTGSGTMMWFLQLIYEAAGSTKAAYTWVLIGYSFVLALWIPLLWWMMPNDSFKVGEVYLLRDDWRFEKRLRGDLGRTYRRATALQDYVANARLHEESIQNGNAMGNGNEAANRSEERRQNGGLRDIPHTDSLSPAVLGIVPDSADQIWNELAEATDDAMTGERDERDGKDENAGTAEGLQGGAKPGELGLRPSSARSVQGAEDAAMATTSPEMPPSPSNVALNRRVEDAEVGHESMPLPSDVSYGPLVFESRRFVDLRKKSFSEQVRSTESLWMGVFYTLNVFFQQVRSEPELDGLKHVLPSPSVCLSPPFSTNSSPTSHWWLIVTLVQFYLGSQRLQLEHKGDEGHAYASFGQVVVAFAGFTIPIIAWLLDKKGYGVTLGTINAISVLSGAFMAIPWLWIQSFTLTLWMVGRFFMYSSYFVRSEVAIRARTMTGFSLETTLVSSRPGHLRGPLWLQELWQVGCRRQHCQRFVRSVAVPLDVFRHSPTERQLHVDQHLPGDYPVTPDVLLLQDVWLGAAGSGSYKADGR